MAEHVANPALAVPGARANYLRYRRVYPALAGALALTAVRFALWVIEDFQRSSVDGWSTVLITAYIFGGGLVLLIATVLGCWIPALIRIAVLSRRPSDAEFFLLRNIPNFWDRLPLVDPTHEIGARIPNATISLTATRATIWRGVIRPRIVAELPLHQLVSVGTHAPSGIPYKRRILVLTFSLGSVTEEIPIAFRRIGGLGFARVSARTEQEIVSRLMSVRADRPAVTLPL